MDAVRLVASLQMRRAMRDVLKETFKKPKLDAHDVDWIKRLLEELCQRVNALSGNPKLAEEFNRAFDVQLMVQMLEHEAFDPEEQVRYADILFERLLKSCAPVQDRRVEQAQQRARGGKDMGWLICEANAIIDDIELLARYHHQLISKIDMERGLSTPET